MTKRQYQRWRELDIKRQRVGLNPTQQEEFFNLLRKIGFPDWYLQHMGYRNIRYVRGACNKKMSSNRPGNEEISGQ